MTDQIIRKTSRWVKILLTISLALNFLIIGAVAAKFFIPHNILGGNGPHGALGRPAALHRAGAHLMWQLPKERRQELFQLVRKHRQNMQSDLNNLAKTRLDLANAIAEQPDNSQELRNKLDAMKSAESKLHDKSSNLTLQFLQSLTASERKSYAEILKKPPHRRWFKKRSEF